MRRKNYYNRKHAQKNYLIPKADDNKKNYNIFYGDKRYRNTKFRKIKEKNEKLEIHFDINLVIFFIKLLFTLFILLLLVKNNLKRFLKLIKLKKNDNYFACFSGMGKLENNYIHELIEYYLKLGVEKFILADNNDPNTEKFSDVIQDYINDGTVDIIDIINVSYSQSELNNYTYEKYNKTCKWIMFFDFDEFLEVHFEDKKSLTLKQFLSNEIFDKCEAIEFNWVMYTDNNLVLYDNRPLNERFTEPKFDFGPNMFVKSMVRGNLNKTVFIGGFSNPNHVPQKGLKICDSMGRIIENYNPLTLSPPVLDYGYIKHFSDKTAEEYCTKIIKGQTGKRPFDVNDRINKFFELNKFSEEKLKIFEQKFNRKFNVDRFTNRHER